MKLSISIYLITLLLIVSCKQRIIKYDNQEQLEGFIKHETAIDLKEKNSDILIVVLQNEDCICTEPDIRLSLALLSSKKYKDYKKVLIVSRSGHKVFKNFNLVKYKDRIKVIVNENDTLLRAGYIAMTDRIIIYNKGLSTYYADLHTVKPELVEKDLL